jgi:hypothetical protein
MNRPIQYLESREVRGPEMPRRITPGTSVAQGGLNWWIPRCGYYCIYSLDETQCPNSRREEPSPSKIQAKRESAAGKYPTRLAL